MIHSTLLLVCLQTFLHLKLLLNLLSWMMRLCSGCCPWGTSPGGYEAHESMELLVTCLVDTEEGCWEHDTGDMHQLMFNSYQCGRGREDSSVSMLLRFVELTGHCPSEVRQRGQREKTHGLDKALDLRDCRYLDSYLHEVFISYHRGCAGQLVKWE